MRKITKQFFNALMILITLDLMIVMFGLAQIAIEGRTGYWAPFFYTQAEFILHIIN